MKKNMISLSLAILIVCLCIAGVHAETIKMKQVYVPQKQVSIAFPENYITFEKEDAELDPRLAAEGITLAGMRGLFNRYEGIFIFAFPPDFDGDLNVAISEADGISSLTALDQTSLNLLRNTYEKQFSGFGINLLSMEIAQIGDNLFFVSKVHKTMENMNCLQYMTIVDEQAISISLTRNTISDETEDMLKQMVGASIFSKHVARATESKEASLASRGENSNIGLEYYDEELGIHFAIPEGWEQLNLSKNRQTLRMKMSRIDDPYCMILYAANDLWESLTDAEKNALGVAVGSDLDLLADDVEMMALLLGKDKSEVKLRKCAGKSYTMMTITKDTPVGGKIDCYVAATLKNGYLVMYQLYDLTKKYPDSLDSILESVYYD